MTARNFGLSLVMGLVLALATSAPGAEMREWVDRTGKFKVEAELVKFEEGLVYLRKSGGKNLKPIAIERLSDADQAFVRAQTEAAPKPTGDVVPAVDAPATDGPSAPAAPTAGQGGAKTLTWKFVEGATFAFEIAQKSETEVSTPGGPIKTMIDVKQAVRWTIQKVLDNGGARIAQKTSRVWGEAQMPFAKAFKFDTADDSASGGQRNMPAVLLINQMKKAIGPEVQWTMAVDGTVSELQLPPELIAGPGGGGQPGTGPSEMMAQLSAMFGLLPSTPVAPGAQWTRPINIPLQKLGSITGHSTITDEGEEVRDGLTLERLASVDEVEFQAADPPPPGPKLSVNKLTSKTTAWFDAAAGALVEVANESQQELEMDNNGQKSPVTVKSRIAMRRQAPGEANATAAADAPAATAPASPAPAGSTPAAK